jgi:alkane 1-monooxygenase
MNGSRPYQTLRSVPGAPQLPAGYPAMVMLALLPPLWFRVMHPRLEAVQAATAA